MIYSNILDLNEFRKQKNMTQETKKITKTEQDCLKEDVELLISDLSQMIELYEQRTQTVN